MKLHEVFHIRVEAGDLEKVSIIDRSRLNPAMDDGDDRYTLSFLIDKAPKNVLYRIMKQQHPNRDPFEFGDSIERRYTVSQTPMVMLRGRSNVKTDRDASFALSGCIDKAAVEGVCIDLSLAKIPTVLEVALVSNRHPLDGIDRYSLCVQAIYFDVDTLEGMLDADIATRNATVNDLLALTPKTNPS